MAPESSTDRFRRIYETNSWSGGSRSGPGSDPRQASPYRRVLQRFIDDPANGIRTIVDVGCGDWAWTRLMRFGDRRYTGYDVVPELVERLEATHGKPAVSFHVTDENWDDLADGDLLLVKDVLQHLSTERVAHFLNHVLPRYRLAIITNDIARYHLTCWPLPVPRRSVREVNCDIEDGDWRPLDISRAPYAVRVTPLLTYRTKVSLRTLDVKQAVLHRNEPVTPSRGSHAPA